MENPDSLQKPLLKEITEANLQLSRYKERISNILESFTDAFFEVDSEWRITYWNKEAERLLGRSKLDAIGENLWDLYANAIPLKFYTEYHRAVNRNVAVRFEEYFPPKEIWFEVAAFPSGNGLSVYFKDITASKKAIKLIENERQKYRDLFNLSPVPQWVYDLDTLVFLDVNEAAVRHYGYSREEFLAMSLKDIRMPGEIAAFEKILAEMVIKNTYNKSCVKHKKKNGELISVSVEADTVFFEGKNARLVMIIDHTAEIEARQAQSDILNRFNIVSKATSDTIWDSDILTGETLYSPGMKANFGHEKSLVTKQWWQEHVHPDDIDKVIWDVNSLIENHETKLQAEYRFRCADGTYRFVLDRAYVIFNEEGKPLRMIGSMQDVTTRVNNMNAIKDQNTRLQEISWIQSHKVRSPLAKILGLVSLMKVNDTDLNSLKELIPLLASSAEELDQVLREIIKKTERL